MIIETRMTGATETIRSLARVERAIRRGTSDVLGRTIANEAQRIVTKLTPRQRQGGLRTGSTRRGFQPLYKGWEVIEMSASDSNYSAIIRNKARLSPAGLAILMSLEFGARPHKIPSTRKPYPMVWQQGKSVRRFGFRASASRGLLGVDVVDVFTRQRRTAGTVFAFQVNHPGNKPFRMVQETRRQMRSVVSASLEAFAAQIEAEFGDGFRLSVN